MLKKKNEGTSQMLKKKNETSGDALCENRCLCGPVSTQKIQGMSADNFAAPHSVLVPGLQAVFIDFYLRVGLQLR